MKSQTKFNSESPGTHWSDPNQMLNNKITQKKKEKTKNQTKKYTGIADDDILEEISVRHVSGANSGELNILWDGENNSYLYMYILHEKIVYKSLIIAVSFFFFPVRDAERKKEARTGEFTEAQRRLNIRNLLNYFDNFGVL